MINPRFIEKLNEFLYNKEDIVKGIHFGFLHTYKDDYPELEDYFLEGSRSVFPYEEYQLYAINLLKKNVDTGKNELVVPLFANDDTGEFDDFIKCLQQNYVNSKGHLNNQLEYLIFSDTDKDQFYSVRSKIGENFDYKKLARVVAKYYETTNFALKLTNYLKSAAVVDYNSWES